LDASKAEGKRLIINLTFTDLEKTYVLELANSVLHHEEREPHPDANASLEITHDLFLRMLVGKAGLKDTLFSDELKVRGSRLDLLNFFRLFEKPRGNFAIVTP
jgi:alkyl sulfatase BDS1-like metallo-beta-lactamase superfamily hydrolase